MTAAKKKNRVYSKKIMIYTNRVETLFSNEGGALLSLIDVLSENER